jgi:hypothetical protein
MPMDTTNLTSIIRIFVPDIREASLVETIDTSADNGGIFFVTIPYALMADSELQSVY